MAKRPLPPSLWWTTFVLLTLVSIVAILSSCVDAPTSLETPSADARPACKGRKPCPPPPPDTTTAPPPPDSVTIVPKNPSIMKGNTVQFRVFVWIGGVAYEVT